MLITPCLFPVVPEMNKMVIKGLPDAAEVGTRCEITCEINRFRPESKNMYWFLNGKMINVKVTKSVNNDGKTFKHRIKLIYV